MWIGALLYHFNTKQEYEETTAGFTFCTVEKFIHHHIQLQIIKLFNIQFLQHLVETVGCNAFETIEPRTNLMAKP